MPRVPGVPGVPARRGRPALHAGKGEKIDARKLPGGIPARQAIGQTGTGGTGGTRHLRGYADLFDYYSDVMPYGTQKARTGETYV
jgi:hypothetical protein